MHSVEHLRPFQSVRKGVYSALLTTKGQCTKERQSRTPVASVPGRVTSAGDLSARTLSGKCFHCLPHTFLWGLYLLPEAHAPMLILNKPILKDIFKDKSRII